MYRTAATCSLLLLLWAVAPAMEELELTATGTVVSATATELTITDDETPATRTSFVIDDDTTITRNVAQEATTRDLTAGTEVTVVYVERDEQLVATSIAIVPVIPPEEDPPVEEPMELEPDADE